MSISRYIFWLCCACIALGVFLSLVYLSKESIVSTAVNLWPFTTKSNYTLSDTTKIDVADGVAKLIAIDQTDDDNTSTGFGGAPTTTNLTWDGTYLGVTNATVGAFAFPEYKKETGWFNMANNIALFHFDEASYSGSTGEVTESSGDSSLDGGLTRGGDATTVAAGYFGRAVEFDGTDDYLSTTTANYLSTSQSGTLMYWVKPDNFDNYYGIFTSADDSVTNRYVFFGLWQTSGQPYIYANFGGTGSARTSQAVSIGEWTHVAISSNGSRYKFYVNGKNYPIDNGTDSGNWFGDVANRDNVVVGAMIDSGGSPLWDFDGKLDELAIFDKELSASEIERIYEFQGNSRGYLDSRIIDAGSSTSWTDLSWVPKAAYGKELPGNATNESGYTSDMITMTSNVGLWHLNDTSWTDSSTNTNSGTSENAVSLVDGIFGSAAEFDASGEGISIAEHASLDPTDAISVEAWVYADNATIGQFDSVALQTNSSAWTDGGYGLFYQSSSLKFFINNYSTNVAVASVSTNEWVHVVGTYDKDAASSQIKIYINGYLVGTDTYTSAIDYTSGQDANDNLHIGIGRDTANYSWGGMIDEVALYNEALDPTEVLERYKRGVQNIKFQVRSCDDANCDGEEFVGFDSTSSTFFTEFNSGGAGATPSTTTLPLGNNRYIQYRSIFRSVSTTITPELSSVTVGPTHYPGDRPTIITNDGQEFVTLSGFSQTLGASNACTDIRYQFAVNNTSTWYFYSPTATTWVAVSDDYDYANTSTPINTNISTFPTDVSTGTLYTKAFLASDTGTQQCEIDELSLTYAGPTVQFTSTSLAVAEDVGTLQMQIELASAYAVDVGVDYTIDTSSSTASGSGTDYTLSNGTVTTTAGMTTTSISITINDDDFDENSEVLVLSLSAPSNAATVGSNVTTTIIIADNDTAGVTRNLASVNITEGGATADYTLVLDSQPTANVTVTAADAGSEVYFSSTNTSFTTLNWDTPQTVTVSAADDNSAEGAHTATITHSASSGDANYDGISINSVTANITDNDTAGVSLSEGDGVAVAETGTTTDTYTVVLTTEPANPVTITIATSTNNITLSTSTLVYRAENWDTAKTVTVTAIDDAIDNTQTTFTTSLSHTASSADANYNAIAINNTTVTITDNDTAGVTQSATALTITEGSTGTYTFNLDTAPTSTATLAITAPAGITLSTSSIAFTSDNYNTAQTITVTVTDDEDAESGETATITHAITSSDEHYNGNSISNLTVNITDNDSSSNNSGGAGFGASSGSGGQALGIPGTDISQKNAADNQSSQHKESNPPETKTVQASVGEKVSITNPDEKASGSSGHSMTIDKATDDKASGILESDPIIFEIEKNETKPYDLNADEVQDIFLTYHGLDASTQKPRFSIIYTTNEAELNNAITINRGSYTTNNPVVSLQINKGESEKITQIAISNTPDFKNSRFIPYTSEITNWELVPCNGTKVVYIKFRTDDGATATANDTIILTNQPCGKQDENKNETQINNCPLEKGKPYKTTDSTAVWYITKKNPCTKRPFQSATVYFSYFSTWDDVQETDKQTLNTITSDPIAFMPWGPKHDLLNGAVIKSITNPKVYVVVNATKYWFTSNKVFSAFGFLFDWVQDVSEEKINAYIPATPIETSSQRIPGMMVRYTGSKTIYQMQIHPKDPTTFILHPLANEAMLNILQYDPKAVITIEQTEQYEIGNPL